MKGCKYIRFILSAVSIVFLLIPVFIPVVQISGDSMSPTLKDRDIAILLPFSDIEAGDVCCFYLGEDLYVKRVVALENSIINTDTYGCITVDGSVVTDKISRKAKPEIPLPHMVPKDHLFVLGDNNINSVDSRFTGFSDVNIKNVIGVVVLVFHY